MPKVHLRTARNDLYNTGLRVPDTKTKSGYRRDRSKPANDEDTLFVSKGETYYVWGMMIGGRGVERRSTTKPTRSQLTNSDFLGQIYDIEDSLNFSQADDVEDLQSMRDSVVEDLRSLGSEQEDKFSNMPDGLQQGDTGQLIEARGQSCEAIADEFEGIDFNDCPDDSCDVIISEWLEEKKVELDSVSWDYE